MFTWWSYFNLNGSHVANNYLEVVFKNHAMTRKHRSNVVLLTAKCTISSREDVPSSPQLLHDTLPRPVNLAEEL